MPMILHPPPRRTTTGMTSDQATMPDKPNADVGADHPSLPLSAADQFVSEAAADSDPSLADHANPTPPTSALSQAVAQPHQQLHPPAPTSKCSQASPELSRQLSRPDSAYGGSGGTPSLSSAVSRAKRLKWQRLIKRFMAVGTSRHADRRCPFSTTPTTSQSGRTTPRAPGWKPALRSTTPTHLPATATNFPATATNFPATATRGSNQ